MADIIKFEDHHEKSKGIYSLAKIPPHEVNELVAKLVNESFQIEVPIGRALYLEKMRRICVRVAKRRGVPTAEAKEWADDVGTSVRTMVEGIEEAVEDYIE